MNPDQAHPQESPLHPDRLVAVLLFAFVLLLGLFSAHESGTWLHIRTGTDILARHALPSVDTYSYTATGRAWSTDSWLSDVLFSNLERSGGFAALVCLKAIVIASAFALLLPLSAGSPLLAAATLALGAVAAWPGMSETAACFDFLLLALLIRVLQPKSAFSWSTALQVGIVELLWSNLHGAGALVGLWLVAAKVIKVAVHAGPKERLRFAALLAAGLAGLALNPHGLGAAKDAFMAAAPALQQPSPWLNLYGLFVLAGAAGVWVCLQQEFFLALSAAGLLAASLIVPAQRPLFILSACPVVALALGHLLRPRRTTAAGLGGLALALAALFTWHWHSVYLPLGRCLGRYGSPALDGALNYLKANGALGRSFNEPGTGDEILGRSDREVFSDGRAGLYEASFLDEAAHWPEHFQELAQAYRFDSALIRNQRAAYPARVLDADPDWSLAYLDDAALVYVRRSGATGWLAAGASRRLVPANQLWPDALDSLLADRRLRPKALAELDGWILQSPESVQPLLWKAYACDRLGLPDGQRLLSLAQARLRWRRDPELMVVLGRVLEKRGQLPQARRCYQQAAALARGQSDASLEAAVRLRLAGKAP